MSFITFDSKSNSNLEILNGNGFDRYDPQKQYGVFYSVIPIILYGLKTLGQSVLEKPFVVYMRAAAGEPTLRHFPPDHPAHQHCPFRHCIVCIFVTKNVKNLPTNCVNLFQRAWMPKLILSSPITNTLKISFPEVGVINDISTTFN